MRSRRQRVARRGHRQLVRSGHGGGWRDRGARERRGARRGSRRGRRGRRREPLRAYLGGLRGGDERRDLAARSGAAWRRARRCRTPARRASGRATAACACACCVALASAALACRELARGGGQLHAGRLQLPEHVFALARDPAQVVEARQRLVEVLRAEHDLERLDVPLLVEHSQPAGELLCAMRDPAFAIPSWCTRLARSARSESAFWFSDAIRTWVAESCSSSE